MDCATRRTISWSVHPALDRVRATLAAMAVIVAVSMAVLLESGDWRWAVLSAGVLLVSLNRFFLPSRYSIDERGITANYPFGRKRFLWADVRRFDHDDRGGYLSTRRRASRWDGFRGMHILFGRRRAEVIESIRASLTRHGASPWLG